MSTLFGLELSREELLRRVGSVDQVAGIKAVEAADGPGRGCRIFQAWTGTGLYFEVLADRALDVGVCRFKGVPLSWIFPIGEVHPAYYEAEGLGWLRSFQGGLFVTCGLDHFGGPFDYPDGPGVVHGRISNLPARAVGYRTYWSGDDYVLEVSGAVRQARLYGENLLLERRISTRLGSNAIRIEDVVTNDAFARQRHLMCYHFNIGYPLVSEESRLHLETEETIPHDANAEAAFAAWRAIQPPTPGWQQQNFWHSPVAGPDGLVRIELENPRLGLGLRWTYEKASLPHFLQWKQMGEGAYLMGLEPCNTRGVAGWGAVKDLADLPHLAPGESRSYTLDVEVVEHPPSP